MMASFRGAFNMKAEAAGIAGEGVYALATPTQEWLTFGVFTARSLAALRGVSRPL
jgi:hypothetical protein